MRNKNDFLDNLKEDIENLNRDIISIANRTFKYLVNRKKFNTDKELIPTKNESLVAQYPKDLKRIKLYKRLSIFFIIIFFLLIFIFIDTFEYDLIFPSILFGVSGFIFYRYSRLKKDLMMRYHRYLREFGRSTVVKVEDLAVSVGKNIDFVIKDINYFIKEGYLKEARFVENNRLLLLDRESYIEYNNYLTRSEELNKNIEENKKIEELKLISIGLSDTMKAKVKEIIFLSETIEEEYECGNLDKDSYEKFNSYYLPTIIKLLKEYVRVSDMDLETYNTIKKEIEDNMDLIINSFRNLINSSYKIKEIDIKSEIKILKTMLNQDGLL